MVIRMKTNRLLSTARDAMSSRRREHFDDPQKHQGETHGERHLRSFDHWNQQSPESKVNWRRPADAVNLLASIAMAE